MRFPQINVTTWQCKRLMNFRGKKGRVVLLRPPVIAASIEASPESEGYPAVHPNSSDSVTSLCVQTVLCTCAALRANTVWAEQLLNHFAKHFYN